MKGMKQSYKSVDYERSMMAMRAGVGSRAGFGHKSDALGCSHWGVFDMLSDGQIHEYGHCGKLAKDLEKKPCNPAEGVYCYVCDNRVKGEENCKLLLCHPCLTGRKRDLDNLVEEPEEGYGGVKRATRSRRR